MAKLRGAEDGKPFKKNDPRINREGRPRKLPDLDAVLIEILEEEINSQVAIKAILIGLRKKAIAGDVRAAELILDRAYGKLKLQQEISGRNGEPLIPPARTLSIAEAKELMHHLENDF